jgi:hypothetical protein
MIQQAMAASLFNGYYQQAIIQQSSNLLNCDCYVQGVGGGQANTDCWHYTLQINSPADWYMNTWAQFNGVIKNWREVVFDASRARL